jgi:hypothetical protein
VESAWTQSPIIHVPGQGGMGNLNIAVTAGSKNQAQAALAWIGKVDGPDAVGGFFRLFIGVDEVLTVPLTGAGNYNFSYMCGTENMMFSLTSPHDGEYWYWHYTRTVTDLQAPQMEQRYEYAGDGSVKRISLVDQTSAPSTTYGPEKYVVEYFKDKVGRSHGKTVRTKQVDDESIHYTSDYQYDGRGRLIRERILRWDATFTRMVVTQDIRTTYDLGNNPTTIEFFDEYGLAYTETRTYARGYQLTDCAVTIPVVRQSGIYRVNYATTGSYTYDINNNITGTKLIDILLPDQGSLRLYYRSEWHFAYDGKNRLKSHYNTNSGGNKTVLWYDALGRVFQRSTMPISGITPEITLTRYVFDGSTLVQEHEWTATESEGSYVYSYNHITRDYLYQAGGIRQRESSDGYSFTDRFLVTDGGPITASIDKGITTNVIYNELSGSGTRQAGGSHWEGKLSNLFSPNNYLEDFGGSIVGPTAGHDPILVGGGHPVIVGLLPPGQGPLPRDASGCPLCCYGLYVSPYDYYSHFTSAGDCYGIFGGTTMGYQGILGVPDQESAKACWEEMCCSSCSKDSIYSDLKQTRCAAAEAAYNVTVNCNSECCSKERYDKLPRNSSLIGNHYAPSRQCGGHANLYNYYWGQFQNNHDFQFKNCSSNDIIEIKEAIRNICLSLNTTGCLSHCLYRKSLCLGFEMLCNSNLWIGYDTFFVCGNPSMVLDGYPFLVFLDKGLLTTSAVFHELVHSISNRLNFWTSELQAYNCMETCNDDLNAKGIRTYGYYQSGTFAHLIYENSLDGCCCTDLPGSCSRLVEYGIDYTVGVISASLWLDKFIK